MKFLMALLLIATILIQEGHTSPPPLQLSNTYSNTINIKNYWVSEKYDGVRAYWNGQKLISRQGNVIRAPNWFTQPLPNTPLDGELWIERGQFEKLSGIIRQKKTIDKNWKHIKYMVFDLPGSPAIFDLRLQQLERIIQDINSAHIRSKHIELVKQTKILSNNLLIKKLDSIAANNAEGLMLHLGTSIYKNTRSNDLLKLKKHYDAEATVIKHIKGNGKFSGIMGAMLVEMPNKKRFKIGTGFTNAERATPPPIGSIITYKFFSLTNKGTPRFASFLRIRKQH